MRLSWEPARTLVERTQTRPTIAPSPSYKAIAAKKRKKRESSFVSVVLYPKTPQFRQNFDRMNRMNRIDFERGLNSESVFYPVNPVHPVKTYFSIAACRAVPSALFCGYSKSEATQNVFNPTLIRPPSGLDPSPIRPPSGFDPALNRPHAGLIRRIPTHGEISFFENVAQKHAQTKSEKAQGAEKGRFGGTNPFWIAPKIGKSSSFPTTYNQ